MGRFWTELGKIFDKFGEEPSVRAVVLASALPKLFSAGIDCAPIPLFPSALITLNPT